MPALDSDLRRELDKAVRLARDCAEEGATLALRSLAVDQPRAFDGLTDDRRQLRNALRAEGRRLGDPLELGRDRPFALLVAEVAYHHWHRMLFARFLAENGLLMHPAGVAVGLADCADLAREEGEDDAWVIAARYASAMLPGIFRPADPVSQLRLAPEHRQALERLVAELPVAVFTADDSLGWVYQFWQAKKKDEINRSERKIGGADIGPVTQLFTEDYMVKFLLHNTLGAWWVARHGTNSGAQAPSPVPNPPPPPVPTSERTGEGACAPLALEYLRLNDDGTPAAGAFEGWPSTAAELKVMDPCCGSGHFLVAAFEMLLAMRQEEEGLSEAAAGEAVLRDNLHGLEIDPRCTQIAAFSLALAAWKRGGYRALPLPNVACSGLAVGERLEDWLAPAGDDTDLRAVLRRLFHLFREAPTLGSLIDPRREVEETRGTLFELSWDEVLPGLEAALGQTAANDPVRAVFGEAARGAARAAGLLADRYHLVCTNVPYLARGKHDDALRAFCADYHRDAKADLATCFVERGLAFCAPGGTTTLVTPQNWLFLTSYRKLRERLLHTGTWNVVARLGPGAFETIGGEVVNVALLLLTTSAPAGDHAMLGLDASEPRVPSEKARLLREGEVLRLDQAGQLGNPDARVTIDEAVGGSLLQSFAAGVVGIQTADYAMFGRCYWELPQLGGMWEAQQSTVEVTDLFAGREHAVWWESWGGELQRRHSQGAAYVRGWSAFGKPGVVVSSMSSLPTALYTGELFDNNAAVVLPHDPAHVPAIWCFCSSPDFAREVRRIDQSLKVTNASLVKVPFDLAHWQQVAAERYPNGLPEPWSDDPTQWLFHGHPARSADPLQVAVARLLGYRWPEHGIAPLPSGNLRQDEDGLDAFADGDGIVCLPRIGGEEPAAERLRELLAAAWQTPLPAPPRRQGGELIVGDTEPAPGWSSAVLERLLKDAGSPDLATWLRDAFFARHCKLFHNRPFIWHIWDGRRDGFAALVNYHKLDRAALERLTYTHLGNWIALQRAADQRGEEGANGRLVAAEQLQTKLKLILEGEPPYDIFVRWKPLHEQPLGWEPDLNDGVRMNIRPFVEAGVLRSKFTIKWNKDRGKNPDGSERLNDLHLTLATKRQAREEHAAEMSSAREERRHVDRLPD